MYSWRERERGVQGKKNKGELRSVLIANLSEIWIPLQGGNSLYLIQSYRHQKTFTQIAE